ncbi:MAG: efflux RND transporter periplasmic adaptor subunit [Gemmatimonadota bacterium]|jgi:HlyD family secretion protein|nr:efflux RND transporter periplasmic adaptor subunit [Gemmatimonadota bacterium]
MRASRKFQIAALGVVALAGAAYGVSQYRAFLPKGDVLAEATASSIISGIAPEAATEALMGDISISVSGAPVVRGTMIIHVNAAGQAEAWQRMAITPLTAGRIGELSLQENQAVGAGQTLVVLDPVEAELRVREAEAQLRNAQATHQELTIFDDRITDPAARAEREAFARSRSGLETAELALQRARIELERTRLTAPIAGRVANLRVAAGEWVTPGRELMTVVQLDPIRVEVGVLESEIGYLTPGREARVSFAAMPGEEFAGRIETINPLVESATRTARVTLRVPNPGGRILPGMYARVVLDAREFPDRVMVPRAAILERDRREMLFVFSPEEGRAKWRYVTTGLRNATQVEIVENRETEMVRAGEIVLTDGHYSLVHDARVNVTEE